MCPRTPSALLLATAAALAGAAAAQAAPPPVGQRPGTAVVAGVRVRYLLYLPAAYGRDPARRWPLVLFLHGMGERGSDPAELLRHPLPKLLATRRDFPAVVVSPQLPLSQDHWRPGPLAALLDRIEARYRTDPRRVYVTGLSMGGFGTWALGLAQPERFAALVPVAGGWAYGSRALPEDLCRLRDVPIWAFHGLRDTIVPAWQTRVVVDALRACGGRPRVTYYPAAGHEGSWTAAYASPALWRWLFSQKLG